MIILITYIILGIALGYFLFDGEEIIKRIWLGGVTGMMLLMWSHVPFSFFLGFTIGSHLLGLLLSCIILALVILYKKPKQHDILKPFKTVPAKENTLRYILMGASVLLLTAVSVVIVCNHTIVARDGAYYTGQCTYGDMNMHLGFISSIAEQKMFPPTYSILAGEPLNYPFLCDSISSSVYIFGTGLRAAYIAPMVFAFVFVYAGIWFLAEAILKKPWRTCLAYFTFVLDGGFGIIYFLDNTKQDKTNFTRIFEAFYETPTNLIENNVRWTNIVADMLVPQRATLFGWTCLFAVLYVLFEAVFNEKKEYYLITGIMAGLLPMIHTHSYFAVGLIAIAWIICSVIREKFSKKIIFSWLTFGIPALVLSVPQLLKWTFNAVGDESFLRLTFNWVNASAGDSWLWFWIKNLGLVFLLIIPAFIHADSRKKCIYSGAFLIFAISEFILFQPNPYDNIKLFFIWFMFMGIMVADYICDIFERLKGIRGRYILAAMLVFILTVSGTLTIAREVVSGDKKHAYQLYNKASVDAAEWIKENTEPTSVFLCCNNHNNAVSSLSGRNIYVGAGTFLYYHGVNYQEKEANLESYFSNGELLESVKNEENIDYIYIGDYEINNYNIDYDYFYNNYDIVYENEGVTIIKIR